MTELVILRCLVVASLVWFIMSEYLHHHQIKDAYKIGYRKAMKINLEDIHEEVRTFLKEYEEDLKLVVEAMEREQSDQKRTGETGSREK